MKTKIFLIGFFTVAFLMVSCEHHKRITPEPEKNAINAIFQSLNTTTEQFATNLSRVGFHQAGNFPYIYSMTFTNVNLNTDYDYEEQAIVGISYKNDTVIRAEYHRYLNGVSNPAAYYKLFSDMIAEHGYADWHGYYEDPASVDIMHTIVFLKNYSSANIATDRNDLCEHINNDNLFKLNRFQYFLETFTYTHTDNSQWAGQIILYTVQYPIDMDEVSNQECKDIELSFSLERIE